MSAKVVTFGEIMLRLKSPAYERLMQSPMLEATFGGGEANVSVSLANYGMETAFVTVLPDNDLGRACMRELRGFGVDTTKIVFKPGRMGIYYLETGAVQRPSKVIYDRAGSAIAEATAEDIDWDKAFAGATWFHITGISPAISQGGADLSLAAVKAAKRRLLLLTALATAALLVTMLLRSELLTRIYIVMPLVLCILPTVLLWMGIYNLLTAGESVRRDQSDRIHNRFAGWSVVLIVLSVFSLTGQIIVYLGAFDAGGIPVTVCTIVLLLCGALIFRGKDDLRMEEIPSGQ